MNFCTLKVPRLYAGGFLFLVGLPRGASACGLAGFMFIYWYCLYINNGGDKNE